MTSEMTAVQASLWKNRELWWQFTKRQVELRHKGSHLGLAWSFLSPMLMLALYVLVFGKFLGGRFRPGVGETQIEYTLIMFLGLAIHHFVAEILTTAPMLVLANPNFVKKVVFPLEILPAANVGAALVHFFITLGLVFGGALIAGVPLTAGVVWLPVLILPLLISALGLALGLSALGVFWRDLIQITQFCVLALMFASAVFYPVSQISAALWSYLRFNPMLLLIQEARGTVFWGQPLNFSHLGYLYAFAVVAFALGSLLFQRLRGSFADVL